MRYCLSSIVTIACLLSAGCGSGNQQTQSKLIADLKNALQEPITDTKQRDAHNDLVKRVVQSGALENKPRLEIAKMLGQGYNCVDQPACREQDFQTSDWYYEVGTKPKTDKRRIPLLFIAFDTAGYSTRTYYLTPE